MGVVCADRGLVITSTPRGHDGAPLTLVLYHVVLPALAPLAVVGLYFTPLTAIGCRDRGLLALGVVAVSLVAALVCVAVALRARLRDGGGSWWMLSTAILALPAALLLGPLG